MIKNKKKKCTKTVFQNKRNKIFNRYYKSRIKNIFRNLLLRFKNQNAQEDFLYKIETSKVTNTYYSFLDKAVNKNVININWAAKKKIKIHNLKKKLGLL